MATIKEQLRQAREAQDPLSGLQVEYLTSQELEIVLEALTRLRNDPAYGPGKITWLREKLVRIKLQDHFLAKAPG